MDVIQHSSVPWTDVRPGVTRRIIVDPATAPGLGLVYLRCEPGTGASDHIHPYQEAYTVLEGTMELWIGQQRWT